MSQINNFAVIIGAMKCGTTSLFRYLDQHPQICGNASKQETMFFSRPTWESGLEGYLQLWDSYNPEIHKIALESATEYTKLPIFPDVAERILEFSKEYNVRFKFLYIVRNPLDMIASGMRHSQHEGWHKGDKQAALNRLVNVANYSMQISRYYERFAADDILILHFSDLVENPLSVMSQISAFLGIDEFSGYEGLNKVFNSAAARTQRDKQKNLRQSLSKIKLVNYVSRLIPRNLKGALLSVMQKTFDKTSINASKQHEEVWTLDDDERAYIIDKLRPGLDKLQNEYKFDISRWSI